MVGESVQLASFLPGVLVSLLACSLQLRAVSALFFLLLMPSPAGRLTREGGRFFEYKINICQDFRVVFLLVLSIPNWKFICKLATDLMEFVFSAKTTRLPLMSNYLQIKKKKNRSGMGMGFILNNSGTGAGLILVILPGAGRDRSFIYFQPGIGTGQDWFLRDRDGTGVKIHSRVSLQLESTFSVGMGDMAKNPYHDIHCSLLR